MTEIDDRKLLDSCLAKGLVDHRTAQTATARARRDGLPVADVLLAMEAVAAPTLAVLQRELVQELAPSAIAGFRIVRKLGQGGMGTVYLAEQTSLRREVALKVVAPQLAADAQAVDRFMREARAAAAVNHPNIISVIDVGYDHGQLYMALELVMGGDAAQLAARSGGRLPETRALEIIRDCARGLRALHEAHLVHRDIKPANIFITTEGIAKLADLGLARSAHGDDRLTDSGQAVGTPAFMSPEQAGGTSGLDIRSDIYALGATLFTLVTGMPPFTGNSIFAVAAKVLTQVPPDPRAIVPGLSEATCRVIARCLAKSPEERFQSPRELEAALTAALTGIGRTPATVAKAPPRKPRSPPPRRAGSSWMLIGIPLAVVVVAGIAWSTAGSAAGARVAKRDPEPPEAEAPKPGGSRAPTPAAAVDLPSRAHGATSSSSIPGLVGHWPFDEGAGSQVLDRAGISAPGSVLGATWTTGRIGGALAFSPPSKVLLGNAPRLAPSAEITVMCWIKMGSQTIVHDPVSVLRHDGHFTALQFIHDGTAHVNSWAWNGVNPIEFNWRGAWDDQRWHHYAATHHQDVGVRIYRDGVLYHTSHLKGPLPKSVAAPFILGASEQGGEHFTGALDDVRVYERALSQQEIAAIVAAAE